MAISLPTSVEELKDEMETDEGVLEGGQKLMEVEELVMDTDGVLLMELEEAEKAMEGRLLVEGLLTEEEEAEVIMQKAVEVKLTEAVKSDFGVTEAWGDSA